MAAQVDIAQVIAAVEDAAVRCGILVSPGAKTTADLVKLLGEIGLVAAGGFDLRRRITWLAETEEGEGYVAVGRLEYALFRSGQVR